MNPSKKRFSGSGKRKSDTRNRSMSDSSDKSSQQKSGGTGDITSGTPSRERSQSQGEVARNRRNARDTTNTASKNNDGITVKPLPDSANTQNRSERIRKVEGPSNHQIWETERKVRQGRTEVVKWIFEHPPDETVPEQYRRAKEEAIVPKSVALQPEAFYMAYTGKPEDIEYIKTMATAAQQHEFEVRVVAADMDSDELSHKGALKTLPIKIIKVSGAGIDKWVEDSGSFGGKTISIALPSLLPSEAKELADLEREVAEITAQMKELTDKEKDHQLSMSERLQKLGELKGKRLPLQEKISQFQSNAEELHKQMRFHIRHERYERLKGSQQGLLDDEESYSDETVIYNSHTITPLAFDPLGQVALNGVGRSKLAIGLTEDWKLRADICHLEGGNVLTGIRSNGKDRYALVGWDSVSQSRFFLALEGLAIKNNFTPLNVEIRKFIEEWLPDKRMKDLIAADLGLDANQVHFIEEPADFHLDLSMGILTNDRIILDDPDAAAKILIDEAERVIKDHTTSLQEKLCSEIKNLINKTVTDEAEQLFTIELVDEILGKSDQNEAYKTIETSLKVLENEKALEAMGQLDEKLNTLSNDEKIRTLKRAIAQTLSEAALKSYYMGKIAAQLNDFIPDIKVVRGPLALEGDLTQGTAKILPRMNFANFEAGTGKDGTQFLILNGGTKEVENSTRNWLIHDVGFKGDIIFVDAIASEASLKTHGGMGCRAKACGNV
ncbi:MAG TPA: hypothetical protein V6C78_26010 [Crinalium sp.]|jgi:hypothetical protein